MNRTVSAATRGARLQQAMKARGVNKLCVLASVLEVSESAISRWRNGGPITVENAVLLCDAMDVSLDWLLLGRGNMESPARLACDRGLEPYTRLPERLREKLDPFLHALLELT